MERRYRNITLKKRKWYIQFMIFAVIVGILTRSMHDTPKTFMGEILRLGTNCMQPAVFKFEMKKEDIKSPFLLWLFVPMLLTYTWQEKESDFEIIHITRQELPEEQGAEEVYISITGDRNLSLLQENIYMAGTADFTETEKSISLENRLHINSSLGILDIDYAKYANKTELIKDFYVIDASTSSDTDLLDINTLTSYDCTIDKTSDGPQILVYHSHSQEGFADSVAGDESTTIVGAGEKLSQLLEEVYGYDVLHHKGVYDVPSRDDAYSNALPDIERVLAENPSIQVVIDLHRDAVAEGTKLVTTMDGKDYARFMFFNGICRSTTGSISYLDNPYLKENMAFSFMAQRVAEGYFPGITRKIYLKAWRYNMHLRPRNMLIELGAQTNTVEEIMNTIEILAFVIDKVLSGQ